MAMARSVAKAFHLISDTEAGEACERPDDKEGGGGLHAQTPSLTGGVWTRQGVRVEAVALSVCTEV